MSQISFTNLFLVLSLYISTCRCITKSVSLTPKDPSFITLLKGATNYAPFEWDLYAVDETQFNMKIHLNKSWSFHDKYPTKLTFEIGSDTATNPTTSRTPSLIVSFSQNHATYVTAVVQIGGTDDHFIYPPPNSAKQNYGEGDIESLVSQPHGTRIAKATNNASYGHFEPFTFRPNISYPLQFVMENHPDFDYMIFSYSNPLAAPRNVVYFAMDPNEPLDIYLSAGAEGDNFDITHINIMHTISAQTVETDRTETITPDAYPYAQSTTAEPTLTNETHWFQKALAAILIATVVILCCLFCVFGGMFTVIVKNHKNAARTMAAKQKQHPTLGVMHPMHIHQGSALKSSSSTTTVTTPTVTVTVACTPPSHATVPSTNPTLYVPSNATPTLTDILAVLAPKSTSNLSFRGVEHKRLSSVGTPQAQRDVNMVYNDMTLPYCNQRSRGDTMNSGGEMDENDNISEENAHDQELEAMYNPPSKADIRRATMRSSGTTSAFGDALAVDDGVNRVSIRNLEDVIPPKLRISLQLASSAGDSDGLYDAGNEEGTPFGSTDTQTTDRGGITPYGKAQSVIV